tara:strand:- start:106 stop:393 length:288 start_codon:yes stop_codon:yes gene_type:complete
MFDYKAFKDGVLMTEDAMVGLFTAMMEDRDVLSSEEWLGRYAYFLLEINRKVSETAGKNMTEDELFEFTAIISHQIYTKEYDERIKKYDKPEAEA